MTGQELYAKCAKEAEWPVDDLCDPPMDPREAVHVLIDHFLGPDWYVVMPESDDQVITAAVCEILDKYPVKQTTENKLYMLIEKLKNQFKEICSMLKFQVKI